MLRILSFGHTAMTCKACQRFFSRFRCSADQGECDCPKCQGFCKCVRVTRYVVAKDYYKNGDSMRDDFPVLYATNEDADAMRLKLEGGSDKSFFDKDDEDEAAILYIDTIEIEE